MHPVASSIGNFGKVSVISLALNMYYILCACLLNLYCTVYDVFSFQCSKQVEILFTVLHSCDTVLLYQLYVHAMILTKAVRILLSNRISEGNLQLAEKLLKKFCKLNEEYYG